MAYDTIWVGEALEGIPLGMSMNIGSLLTNRFVLQAYKDLGQKLPSGPISGPAQLPKALGKPSAQAARLISLITGKILRPEGTAVFGSLERVGQAHLWKKGMDKIMKPTERYWYLRFTTVVTAGALFAGISGCASSSPAPTASQSSTGAQGKNFLPASLKGASPGSVKIGFAGGFGLTNISVLAALGLGYYNQVASRFHTTISVDIFGGATELQPAMLGGSAQFGVGSVTGQLPDVLHGEKELDLSSQSIVLTDVLSAAAKYKSRGANLKAFAGDTWCQLSSTGSSNAAARVGAALAGVSFSKLRVVTIGNSAAVVPSMTSGRCAIVSGDINSAAAGADNGQDYIVKNYNDPRASIPVSGQEIGNVVWALPAFVAKYPQLTQAFVDATMKGLSYVQEHLNNDDTLYAAMPASYRQTNSLGVFSETWSLCKVGFSKQFATGEFSTQMANDTIWDGEALQGLAPGTATSPRGLFTNKYAIQAYKDLGLPEPTGPAAGPAQLPQSLGKPSAQAAKLIGIVTGKRAPASDGTAPMLKEGPAATAGP
jgi:ABC-type nitrate/sulfonate/bicarbonate transport system substrate-binding protein